MLPTRSENCCCDAALAWISVSYLVSARATPLESAPDRRPSSSIALVCWFEFGSACYAAPISELDTLLTVVFMELWSVERSSSWMFCAPGYRCATPGLAMATGPVASGWAWSSPGTNCALFTRRRAFNPLSALAPPQPRQDVELGSSRAGRRR